LLIRRDGLEHARLAALAPEPDPRRAERALVELL
jgi:hypothetical protein